jgi:hypothetical protein
MSSSLDEKTNKRKQFRPLADPEEQLEKISSEADLEQNENRHNLIIKLVFKYALLVFSLIVLAVICLVLIMVIVNDETAQDKLIDAILNNLEVVIVFLVGLFLGDRLGRNGFK